MWTEINLVQYCKTGLHLKLVHFPHRNGFTIRFNICHSQFSFVPFSRFLWWEQNTERYPHLSSRRGGSILRLYVSHAAQPRLFAEKLLIKCEMHLTGVVYSRGQSLQLQFTGTKNRKSEELHASDKWIRMMHEVNTIKLLLSRLPVWREIYVGKSAFNCTCRKAVKEIAFWWIDLRLWPARKKR